MKPNLWCLCKESWNPVIVANCSQHVSFTVSVDNQEIGISAIYAATTYISRRPLWQQLNDLQANFDIPWCFIGDFNSVLGSHEYRGSGSPTRISCEEFQMRTACNNLIHLQQEAIFSLGRMVGEEGL